MMIYERPDQIVVTKVVRFFLSPPLAQPILILVPFPAGPPSAFLFPNIESGVALRCL